MTKNVSVGQAGGREASAPVDQIGEWITEIDRDTEVLRVNVSGIKQKYARLNALAEEIRDDLSRICRDFGDFDDDLGHISDAIERMNMRTMRFKVGIARNVSLLERLDDQAG